MKISDDGHGVVEQGGRLHQALALEELVRANAESNDTMISLVEQVRHDAEARAKKVDLLERGMRQTSRLLKMLGAVLVCLLVVAGINAFNIQQTSRQADVTARIARDTQATNAQLYDCTNSQGACGKRNIENTKRILDEVKLYELTGFYCIRTNPQQVDKTGEQFLACMKRLYPTGPTLKGR